MDNIVPVAGGADPCGGDTPSNSDVGPFGGGVPPSNLARRDADSTVPVAGGADPCGGDAVAFSSSGVAACVRRAWNLVVTSHPLPPAVGSQILVVRRAAAAVVLGWV